MVIRYLSITGILSCSLTDIGHAIAGIRWSQSFDQDNAGCHISTSCSTNVSINNTVAVLDMHREQDTNFPCRRFADKSGVRWNIVDIDAGHEAILTKPEEVANLILDSVRQFQDE